MVLKGLVVPSEDTKQLLTQIIDGKIDTGCCPEVDETFKRFQKGDATLEELKAMVERKQSEIMK
jgi:hypothetical protein